MCPKTLIVVTGVTEQQPEQKDNVGCTDRLSMFQVVCL